MTKPKKKSTLPPLVRREFKAWLGKLPSRRTFARASPCFCPIACFLREKKGVAQPSVVNDYRDLATEACRPLPAWADDFITDFDALPFATPYAVSAYELLP